MGRPILKRLLGLLLISIIASPYVSYIARADGVPPEPDISMVSLLSLGPTDRWKATVDYHNGSYTYLYLNGTKSDPTLLSLSSEPLNTFVYESAGKQVVQQDILLGFSYSWNYTLEIGEESDVDGQVTTEYEGMELLEFNLELGLPVRIELQYSEPMIEGSSYPLFATLTPLDWPSFNEFNCNFSVFGGTLFDISESFVTPLGPENAWTLEIGPFWFMSIPIIILFPIGTLNFGLAVLPQLFSDHIEAHLEVAGDATLQSQDTLAWDSPGQALQFDVLAEDTSSLDYASILISQFEFFLNRLLIDFNLALQFNWIWGGSSRKDFTLFTLDASAWLPTLSFGTHPSSPAYGIQAEVPVVKMHVIPEVPWGTIMSSTTMIIALLAYVAVPKRRTKSKHMRRKTAS
mgnify:CR=1 FL=1